MQIYSVKGRAISTREIDETLHLDGLPHLSVVRTRDGRVHLVDDGGVPNSTFAPPTDAIRQKYAPGPAT